MDIPIARIKDKNAKNGDVLRRKLVSLFNLNNIEFNVGAMLYQEKLAIREKEIMDYVYDYRQKNKYHRKAINIK